MQWINIVAGLLTNPAIQEMIKAIEAALQHKTAASAHGMAATADHSAALKQAIDEVVAKHVKTS